MKTLALAASLLTLVSGTASAADMAVKAVAPPPMPSWVGFYIGGHGGYGWKDDPFTNTVAGNDPFTLVTGFKSHGWIGGGHVGYNWQYGAMVGGLELDVSGTDIKGNSTPAVSVNPAGPQSTSIVQGHDVKLLASARGRLGWAPNSDWLLYGTGGIAWERAEQIQIFSINSPTFVNNTATSTPFDAFGWLLGTGVEGRLTGTNWIARVEYLHYDFGHTRVTQTSVNVSQGGTSTFVSTAGNQTIDVVRAGLSYKFGL